MWNQNMFGHFMKYDLRTKSEIDYCTSIFAVLSFVLYISKLVYAWLMKYLIKCWKYVE